MGLARTDSAGLYGSADDQYDWIFPAVPSGALAEEYDRIHFQRPEYHKAHGGSQHLPVPVPVYSTGGYGRYRQYRRCGGSHRGRRTGRGILDVAHRVLWHDDQLLRECPGYPVPAEKQQG